MNDPARLADWFGRFISAYRSGGAVAAPPDGLPSRIEFEWDLAQGASLQRHPFSRMAWRRDGRRGTLFANGESWTVAARDAQRIAAAREIGEREYAALSDAGRDLAFTLLESGHYVLHRPGDGGSDGGPGA
jgi:50S ribosomal protein L16 3-hydroxylase